MILALKKIPKKNKNWNAKKPNLSSSTAPFKILNLGGGKKYKINAIYKDHRKNFKKRKQKLNIPNFKMEI